MTKLPEIPLPPPPSKYTKRGLALIYKRDPSVIRNWSAGLGVPIHIPPAYPSGRAGVADLYSPENVCQFALVNALLGMGYNSEFSNRITYLTRDTCRKQRGPEWYSPEKRGHVRFFALDTDSPTCVFLDASKWREQVQIMGSAIARRLGRNPGPYSWGAQTEALRLLSQPDYRPYWDKPGVRLWAKERGCADPDAIIASIDSLDARDFGNIPAEEAQEIARAALNRSRGEFFFPVADILDSMDARILILRLADELEADADC
jgi:hypothetical protein